MTRLRDPWKTKSMEIRKKIIKLYRPLSYLLLTALFFYPITVQNSINPQSNVWGEHYRPLDRLESLIDYLENEGLPTEEIHLLFLDPRVEIYPQIVYNVLSPPRMDSHSSLILQGETENYDVLDFMHRYENYLTMAQEEYGVEPEAVVAILFVETKLGKMIGSHSVFNVLASIALSDDAQSLAQLEDYIHETYHYLPFSERKDLIRQQEERAARKADWARNEMASLIRLHVQTDMDVLELPGSYAGAFGYPQFMPTSVLKWGVDADKDGIVDLYSFPDAILSVANFLHTKGWDNSEEAQKRALYRYNFSSAYVADVLETAATIKSRNLF